MELTIMNFNGIETVDSRQVAEVIGKRHDHLVRDIKKYCEYLTEPKIGVSDFFIESTYQDSTGRTLPCYQITRKGCEMVANKMTGQKGTVFTALYVNAFHAMEQQLQKPTTQLDVLANMANILTGAIDSMKQHEARLTAIETTQEEQNQQIQATNARITSIHDVFADNLSDTFEDDVKKKVNAICQATGKSHVVVYAELYHAVNAKAGCDIKRRQQNIISRKMKQGYSKTAATNSTSQLTVIAADKTLKNVCQMVLKQLCAEYLEF